MARSVGAQNSDKWPSWLGQMLGYGSKQRVFCVRKLRQNNQALGFSYWGSAKLLLLAILTPLEVYVYQNDIPTCFQSEKTSKLNVGILSRTKSFVSIMDIFLESSLVHCIPNQIFWLLEGVMQLREFGICARRSKLPVQVVIKTQLNQYFAKPMSHRSSLALMIK